MILNTTLNFFQSSIACAILALKMIAIEFDMYETICSPNPILFCYKILEIPLTLLQLQVKYLRGSLRTFYKLRIG